jgi:hypothetical protein
MRVSLCERDARVVGPLIAPFRCAAACGEERDDARLDARRVDLLGLRELLLVRDGVEEAVFLGGPPSVAPNCAWLPGELLADGVLRREFVGLREQMRRSGDGVRARLVTTFTNPAPLSKAPAPRRRRRRRTLTVS